MTCTKEEIERKRLAAIEKKRSKTTNQIVSPISSTKVTTSRYFPNSPITGPIKGITNNGDKFHPYSKSSLNTTNTNNTIPVTKVVSGTVYLISEHRFEVNPSEFCTPLINIFKTIASKNYDSKSNLWNFSIDHYHELMEKVAPLAPHVVLGPLPPYILKILKEPVVDPTHIDLSPIEATLREKLLSFQQEGVRFGIARRGRCLIADDMGLGKTFTALALASYYRSDWPLLVVTTSSMRETWQSKISELLPSVPLISTVTLTSRKDAALVADRQTEIVIVSYKNATMHKDLLKAKKFGVIIVDESHNLKSPRAQCTVALTGLSRGARRLLLLSGTPALARPAELYTQLDLIAPRLFGSYTDYGKRYCAGVATTFGWDMSGQSHATELNVLLTRRFLIRRTKEQVLALAEKTRECVMLDESLLDWSGTSNGGSEGVARLAAEVRGAGPARRHAAIITMFAESARVRIPAVCKYLRELLSSSSDKLLVFAHHRSVLAAVCDTLDAAAAPYVTVHGATPPAQRAELVSRFQSSPSCRCAVLSLTAAGAGLTLTAAGIVVFAELHWTPGVLAQAEARAHRLGRSAAVRVAYLRARGTVDDLVWPMLRDKLNVLNDVGLSEDSLDTTLTRQEQNQNKITQYLSPQRSTKNKNDYIPGTNIRKYTENKTNTLNTNTSTNTNRETWSNDLEDIEKFFLNDMDIHEECSKSFSEEFSEFNEDIDQSFLADEEGDELLANIDL